MSLHQAIEQGNIEAIKELISTGADVNEADQEGWTPLSKAAHGGQKEIAELLISNNADLNALSILGPPLHWAADNGHDEIVELLITKGAKVNAKNLLGGISLHSAALAGHKKIVELLIVKGAEINATDGEGQTPLDWSKQQFSNDDISNLLRRHGGRTGEELKAEGK